MLNLLKAEFIKVKKDKAVYIALIIITCLAILMPVMYYFIQKSGTDVGDFSANGRSVFLGALNITNNTGILIPIIIVIVVCKEFSYGTIRNKVISGHKKRDVYLTVMISSLILGSGLFIFNIVLSLLTGILILGYGTAINGTEILFILQTIGLGTLIYAVVLAFTMFASMLVRNVGAAIGISLGSSVLLALLSSLYEIPGSAKIVENICTFIPNYQLFRIMETNLDGLIIIQSIVTSLVYLAGLTVGGIYLFKKNDLK